MELPKSQKGLRGVLVLSIIVASSGSVRSNVPQDISHQGVVTVNGQRFQDPNGTLATFYFALVSNSGNGTNLWTNDGSSLGTLNRPIGGVQQVSVVDGVYSVSLGGGTMAPIQPAVFNNASVVLRIWFDDGSNGVHQLAPDQSLASAPYAHRSAFEPPIGTILAWHKNLSGTPALSDGWVECNGQVLNDSSSPYHNEAIPNLNIAADGYSRGRFLRGSTTSGEMQDGMHHYNDDGASIPLIWFNGGIERDIQVTDSPAYDLSAGTGTVSSSTRSFSATRPVNMSVVWIMRVK